MSNLQQEIYDIACWMSDNNMKLNAKKTQEFIKSHMLQICDHY
jgi:hypothetical protein